MSTFEFANNVFCTLNTTIGSGDTSIILDQAVAPFDDFPDPTNGGIAVATLMDNRFAPTKVETVTYTGITSGGGTVTLTGVTRGQEGTSAQAWTAGAHVFQALTANSLRNAYLGNVEIQDAIFAAGSAAAPSIGFLDNAGIYQPAGDQLAFSTNGAQAVLIDSSQRIGLGGIAPAAELHLEAAANPELRIRESGADAASHYLFSHLGDTQARVAMVNGVTDGNNNFDIDPGYLQNDAGDATVRLFRSTQLTGNVGVSFYRGDNTGSVDHQIKSGTSGVLADFCKNGGDADFGGDILVAGTVDGRDVAADGTKLDGIETAATADQTAGEIEAIVNHDNLAGFVGNEHIDWTAATQDLDTSGSGDFAGGLSVNDGPKLVFEAAKSADETVNNSDTLQNDDDLVYTGAKANTKYHVEIMLIVFSNVTADFKCTFSAPSGANGFLGFSHKATSGAGLAPAAENLSLGTPTVVMRFGGLVELAGTAGSIQFQWAQNTADASNTTVRRGTIMRVWEI